MLIIPPLEILTVWRLFCAFNIQTSYLSTPLRAAFERFTQSNTKMCDIRSKHIEATNGIKKHEVKVVHAETTLDAQVKRSDNIG